MSSSVPSMMLHFSSENDYSGQSWLGQRHAMHFGQTTICCTLIAEGEGFGNVNRLLLS